MSGSLSEEAQSLQQSVGRLHIDDAGDDADTETESEAQAAVLRAKAATMRQATPIPKTQSKAVTKRVAG